MRRALVNSIVALILLSGWSHLHAHDPALHGFKLKLLKQSYGAPEFELDTLDGRRVALSDFSGHHVLLTFWESDCDPCLAQLPSLEELSNEFANHRLDVVTVLVGDEQAARDAQQSSNSSLEILLDPDATLATRLGAKKLPVSFLLNRNGAIIGYAVGQRDWSSEGAISSLAEIFEQ